MEKIFVNGIDIAYNQIGQGAPLLLIHGFPLDSGSWEAVIDKLKQDYRLIIPDLRGFGHSGFSQSDVSMELLADDLYHLLATLKISKTYIAGHSMGGYVALAFVRAHPEMVIGLGMLASQARADTAENQAKRFETAQKVTTDGVTAVENMAEKLSANPVHVPFLREMILRQQPAGLSAALKAMAGRPDSSSVIGTFKFPIVLVHGLADALIPPERSAEMKTFNPSANLINLAGVGHSPMLEAPLETSQALLSLKNG